MAHAAIGKLRARHDAAELGRVPEPRQDGKFATDALAEIRQEAALGDKVRLTRRGWGPRGRGGGGMRSSKWSTKPPSFPLAIAPRR